MQGEELTTTAARHSVEAPKLISLLRGDLDWIVMKCLEKDRTRRYETANGLAADLKRHLNNEPVVARPPSTAYRFQKAFRRNKLVFTAGTAVAAALLLGIIASTWQSVRATRAKREALAAQAQATAQREQAEANEQQAVEAQANEIKLRQQAEAEELAARQRAYASDMNVASPGIGRKQSRPGAGLAQPPAAAAGPERFARAGNGVISGNKPAATPASPFARNRRNQFAAVSPDGNWVAVGCVS